MGLYFTLFYGAIVTLKKRRAEPILDQLENLKRVCAANGWLVCDVTENDGVMTCVIDSRVSEAHVEVDIDTPFHTDPADRRLCICEGVKGHREARHGPLIDERTYRSLAAELYSFVPDLRWIRRDFYSGNMTSTFTIEVK